MSEPRLTIIKIIDADPAGEVRKIANIHKCTQRMVYYALRGQSTSEKAIKIRTTALRRGNSIETNLYADGTRKK